MNRILTVVIAIAIAIPCHVALAATLYVSTDGNDAWSGTLPEPNAGKTDGPFATLQRARDEIRKRKASGPLPAGGIVVELRGGIHSLSGPLELTAQDSGTQEAPIVYRARKGQPVRLVGGRVVIGWKQVKDPAVLERLDASARGHVWQANLKALGITDLQGINSPTIYQSDPGLELFFQDKPMTLARYPNSGYMRIASVLDAEGKPKTGDVTTPQGKFVCNILAPPAG
jgi:hypothetical protein